MPIPAYMTITGESQGNISEGALSEESVGTLSQQDHENEIMIEAMEHEIYLPRDRQSGQPSGQAVHNPLMITKIFDKSSPLLYNALVSGESLSITITWYRTSADGMQEKYFTHKLNDARVVNIKAIMPNCLDLTKETFTHMEEVSFSYKGITWGHESGVEGSTTWGAVKDKA